MCVHMVVANDIHYGAYPRVMFGCLKKRLEGTAWPEELWGSKWVRF